jgi:hypothetical protein
MRKVLLLALCACTPFFRQPLWGRSPSVGKESSRDKKQHPKPSQGNTTPFERGTKDAPFVVDPKGHSNSPEETAKDKADREHKAFVDQWTVGSAIAVALFTGVLMVIGLRGVRAANKTLKEIERQANLMDAQPAIANRA